MKKIIVLFLIGFLLSGLSYAYQGGGEIDTNDNLGNHTATQALNMGSYGIDTSSSIAGIKEITWEDGTVQVSSPAAVSDIWVDESGDTMTGELIVSSSIKVSDYSLIGGVTSTSWDLTSDCTAHWKLNDNASNTTVTEEIQSLNGTFTDAGGDPNTDAHSTTTIRATTRAMIFDGDDDYIACGDILDDVFDYNKTFSIAIWAYWANTGDAHEGLFSNQSTASPFSGLKIRLYGGDILVQVIQDWDSKAIEVEAPFSTPYEDVWTHIVLTYDGSNAASGVKMYFNGIEQDLSVNIDNSMDGTIATNAIFILGRGFIDGRNFGGMLDDVRVFTKTLSQEEINEVYHGYTPGGTYPETNSSSFDGTFISTTTTVIPQYASSSNENLYVDGFLEIKNELIARNKTRMFDEIHAYEDIIQKGGDIYAYDDIFHYKDEDTFFAFGGSDAAEITCGGVEMVVYVEGGSDYIMWNRYNADVDFRWCGNYNDDIMKLDATLERIGIWDTTPEYGVDIETNVYVGGTLTCNSDINLSDDTVLTSTTQFMSVSQDDWVDESGDTMGGDLDMGGYNIDDAGNISASSITISGDSSGITSVGSQFTITGQESLVVESTMSSTGFNISTKRIECSVFTSTGINDCIDALGSDGGEVYLPEGTYTCTTEITIDYDNTTIRGSGWGTILDFSTIVQTFDGINLNGKDYLLLSNFKMVGNSGGGSSYSLIDDNNLVVTDSIFENLYLEGSDNIALILDNAGSTRNLLKDIYTYDTDHSGIYLHDAAGNTIDHAVIIDSGDSAIQVKGDNNRVINCYIYNAGEQGIEFHSGIDSIITNNTVINSFRANIDVNTVGLGGHIISGNTCYDSEIGNNIFLDNCSGGSVEGNLVHEARSNYYGIALRDSHGVSITGNTGYGTNDQECLIYLTNSSSNTIIGNVGSYHDTAGIQLDATSNFNEVVNNNLGNEDIAQIINAGENNHIDRSNNYFQTENALKAITPVAVGEIYYDTTNNAIVISTGTTIRAFGLITNGTSSPTGW